METVTDHRITWFVYAGDEKIRRTATMRGSWPCDAECSCGWATRTGGAVRSFIEKEIRSHKFDVRCASMETPTERTL